MLNGCYNCARLERSPHPAHRFCLGWKRGSYVPSLKISVRPLLKEQDNFNTCCTILDSRARRVKKKYADRHYGSFDHTHTHTHYTHTCMDLWMPACRQETWFWQVKWSSMVTGKAAPHLIIWACNVGNILSERHMTQVVGSKRVQQVQYNLALITKVQTQATQMGGGRRVSLYVTHGWSESAWIPLSLLSKEIQLMHLPGTKVGWGWGMQGFRTLK